MEFKTLIGSRYSVRKLSDKPVEKEKLAKILEAGRIAPTAGNRQPQRIVVVQSKEALTKMQECTPCHFNAPIVLLVCFDKTVEKDNHVGKTGGFGRVDASIVLTHMMLSAADLGLGTTWVGLFKPEPLIRHFHIPKQYEIVSLMPLGYPAVDAIPSPMHCDRFPIEHTVFIDTF